MTSQSHAMHSNYHANKRGKTVKEQKTFTDEEYEYIFKVLLDHDKIDVSDDFYDENILFTSPDQLMDIFSGLEESNLKKIKECQDLEENLEELKLKEQEAH